MQGLILARLSLIHHQMLNRLQIPNGLLLLFYQFFNSPILYPESVWIKLWLQFYLSPQFLAIIGMKTILMSSCPIC